MVDRVGSTHDLEVEVLIVDVGGGNRHRDIDPGMIVNPLAEFREKDRIKSVYADEDGVAHVVYPLDPCPPTPPRYRIERCARNLELEYLSHCLISVLPADHF